MKLIMNEFIRVLFPNGVNYISFSLGMLLSRIIFGILFLIHGLQKLIDFAVLSETFPDPLGFGSEVSLIFVLLAELFCSIAVIFGILYRLALIPMIFTMITATFVFHAGQGLAEQELPFMYLSTFIVMFILGPGRFSFDYIIGRIIRRKD